MADLKLAKTDPEKQFWDQLDGHTAGMLGVSDSGQHMQPMSHFIDRDEKRLYFFTSRDTDLVRALRPGATAHYTFVNDGHDYHCCMKGALTISNDRAKIDEYWSAVVDAWFDGPRDPQLTLLALDLHDAAIWASTGSAVKFGWEIAKANYKDGHTPDLGETNHIDFLRAA
ncbi:pyridoxamine 5'-phosphate oxidase family protein [Pontivivens insulae]|uniref:General stress protein 26 n=1 Tax=Pontivivens insulae TaxID=1639689 RepID=A0A2R8AC66_9RHOB|nr:pyridoxamine 5'-phosphate oxidase family protein [Pontivivens insulae]RED13750.1 general stress protein 26 [Pontivivens insulae]SPF29824.1 General stress protein 26 [Pontivivens insulae]